MQNREKARVWHLLSIYCVSGDHNLIRPQNEKRTSRATWVMQKGRLGLQTPPVQGHTASKRQSQALNPCCCLSSLLLQSVGGRRERGTGWGEREQKDGGGAQEGTVTWMWCWLKSEERVWLKPAPEVSSGGLRGQAGWRGGNPTVRAMRAFPFHR